MKSVFTIFLSVLFLFQAFVRTFIIVNYEVNKDYVSNVLCENKEKKEMHCEGKCHLKKELQKEERKESTPTSAKEKIEITLFIEATSALSIISPEITASSFSYTEIFPQDFIGTIFHPPCFIG